MVFDRIGLGGTFLLLVKGLLEGTISKVHINGLFTKDISITYGVQQGDPLSPLIFALITQPLMDYLQYELSTWKFDGVKITKELTIFHRLFVDDVGIFIHADESSFVKLQATLSLYKVASKAKLNLAKSIIIPLAVLVIPQWL